MLIKGVVLPETGVCRRLGQNCGRKRVLHGTDAISGRQQSRADVLCLGSLAGGSGNRADLSALSYLCCFAIGLRRQAGWGSG